MAEQYYLIDSNAVIDYLGDRMPETGMQFMNEVIDSIAHVSIITKIEVLGFVSPPDDYKVLSGFFTDSVVLYITEEIPEECIFLRKKLSIKLPDAIIAATANVYGLDLITRNTADFESISSLKLINPHAI